MTRFVLEETERAGCIYRPFPQIPGCTQMSIRSSLASLQHTGELLIKRGSALGPLIPTLILCPFLLFSAWLFRLVFVIGGCPIISTLLVIATIIVVVNYISRYQSFAKHDPDRLQSEEYRYETARMNMIAAKELPYPVPAEYLSLDEPSENPAAAKPSSERDERPSPTNGDDETG